MSTTTETAGPAPAGQRGTIRLRPLQYIAYGGGDMANNLAFSLSISFLAVYYTDVALLAPATVGLIFLAMRFVDAFTDILIGSVIDRTNTRMGKFRPYIMIFCVPLVLSAILAFSMPAGLRGTDGALIWAIVTYFLLGSLFYTLVNIPYGSLAAAMTDDSQDRSKLALARTLGSGIMQIITAVAISPSMQKFVGDPDGLQSALTRTIALLGVGAIVLYALLVITSRENVERSVAKVSLKESLQTLAANRALQALAGISVIYLAGLFCITGILVYYARDVLGDARYMIWFAPLLFGMIIVFGWSIPILAKRLGKPRVFQISSIVGVIGALLMGLVGRDILAMAFVGVALVGASSSFVNTLMWNMEADAVEYGEWKTGFRNEGTTYAIFSFVRKMSQALGGWAGLWLIGQFGYVSGAEAQPDSALTGISMAVGVVPAVFFLLAAILVQFYPLTDQRHAEILLDLRTRKDTGILPAAARQEMEAARGAAAAGEAAASSSADGADHADHDGTPPSDPDAQGSGSR